MASRDGVKLGTPDVNGVTLRFPYGFGKDRQRVFYYDFSGKPKLVRKAAAAAFRSLNDGYFGVDDDHVFCGHNALPKADVATWQKIGGYYSRDARRIYYFNQPMAADYDSFEVVDTGDSNVQLARDRDRVYRNDAAITPREFDEWLTGSDAGRMATARRPVQRRCWRGMRARNVPRPECV